MAWKPLYYKLLKTHKNDINNRRYMYTGWKQKSNLPLRYLLIFHQWVQIFTWNFTRLSNNQILRLNANGFTDPQALQIWTHWTITSGAPCWKSTINSNRSIRQLMSRKSLCRPCGKRCHENTSTRRWRSSPSAWLPTWLWLPMIVPPSICNNSVRLQVCILILSPTNLLFSEPPTDYR